MLEAPIKKSLYRYLQATSLLLVLSCIFQASLFANELKGVLIAAKTSPVEKTSILNIRRMYLGLPSSSTSLIKNTVINSSDLNTYKAFLKNVMRMTDSGYKRKIVKRIFRQGGKKVQDIHDTKELVKYLSENPNDVSFMSEDMANKTKGIKVVQKLW